MSEPLTKDRMVAGLRSAGLRRGDSVIVHSSCRALGPLDGGADAVVDALLETVGAEGNLVLPTFNYLYPLPEPHYDPATTPCRTGVINEVGRQRPGAVRSLHPTHSIAVLGPDADELTRDPLKGRTLGIGSAVDRLARMGGKVLLLGVGHTTNTTIHVGEEYAEIPKCRWEDVTPPVKILTPDGSTIEHIVDSSTSCSASFEAAAYGLRRHGEIQDFELGHCPAQLMRGEDIVRRVVDLLSEKADLLLCTRPDCRCCVGAREKLREQGRI